MSDIAEVEVTLTQVDRVHGRGELIALLAADVVIAGVPLQLQGIQVRRDRIGLKMRAPEFRGSDGRWWPAVVLPGEVMQALLDAYLESGAA